MHLSSLIMLIVIAILFFYALFITKFCFTLLSRLQNSRKRYDEITALHDMYVKTVEQSEKLHDNINLKGAQNG